MLGLALAVETPVAPGSGPGEHEYVGVQFYIGRMRFPLPLEQIDIHMTFNITYWWYCLCATAAVNALAWTVLAVSLQQQRGALSAASYIACRRQLLLSAIYVFGCAFRSVLPVYDVGRIVLVNSWISSVLVGRTVATVAELSFVTQWTLMLHQSAVSTGAGSAKIISLTIVPLIALAELCCWLLRADDIQSRAGVRGDFSGMARRFSGLSPC